MRVVGSVGGEAAQHRKGENGWTTAEMDGDERNATMLRRVRGWEGRRRCGLCSVVAWRLDENDGATGPFW